VPLYSSETIKAVMPGTAFSIRLNTSCVLFLVSLSGVNAQTNQAGEVNFTAVQSVNKEVAEEIKGDALELLENAMKVAGPPPSEEMDCLTPNLFKV
jgi:hypothetical protein